MMAMKVMGVLEQLNYFTNMMLEKYPGHELLINKRFSSGLLTG